MRRGELRCQPLPRSWQHDVWTVTHVYAIQRSLVMRWEKGSGQHASRATNKMQARNESTGWADESVSGRSARTLILSTRICSGRKSAPIQIVVRVDTNMHRQPAKSPQNLTLLASPSGKHRFDWMTPCTCVRST